MAVFKAFSSLEVICLNTGYSEFISAHDREPVSALVAEVCGQSNWYTHRPVNIPKMKPVCRVSSKPYGLNFIADFFIPNKPHGFARISLGMHPVSGKDIWNAPHCFGGELGKLATSIEDMPSGPFVLWAINEDMAKLWNGTEWFKEFVRDVPRLWLRHVAEEFPDHVRMVVAPNATDALAEFRLK